MTPAQALARQLEQTTACAKAFGLAIASATMGPDAAADDLAREYAASWVAVLLKMNEPPGGYKMAVAFLDWMDAASREARGAIRLGREKWKPRN